MINQSSMPSNVDWFLKNIDACVLTTKIIQNFLCYVCICFQKQIVIVFACDYRQYFCMIVLYQHLYLLETLSFCKPHNQNFFCYIRFFKNKFIHTISLFFTKKIFPPQPSTFFSLCVTSKEIKVRNNFFALLSFIQETKHQLLLYFEIL